MARAKKLIVPSTDGTPAEAAVDDGVALTSMSQDWVEAEDDGPIRDSQSRGEDPAEPDVPPIDADRPLWYELETRKNERGEWLVSSRGTISRAEDARDMLRVPQSFDLQQAEWARADYTRAGYETRLIRCSRGEGGIVREVVE